MMPGFRAAAATLRTYTREFSALSRNARLYLCAGALSAVATGAFLATYNLYVLAAGHDPGLLGVLLSLAGIGAGAGALLAGGLVDRIGPRPVLLAASLVAAAGIGTQLANPQAATLMAGSVVAGVGAAAFYVATAPFLTQNSMPARRTYLFSLDTAVVLACTAAGSAAGGQIATALGAAAVPPATATFGAALGVGTAALPYWFTLAGASVVGAASFLPLALTTTSATVGDDLPEQVETAPGAAAERLPHQRAQPPQVPALAFGAPGPASGGQASSEQPPQAAPLALTASGSGGVAQVAAGQRTSTASVVDGGWRAILADPVPRRLATIAALIGCGAGLFVPYLNVFFVRELGASPAVFGWLSAAAIGCRLVGTAAAPRLAARVGPVRAIGWTQLASIPLLLTLGFAPLSVVASAAYLLRGALMNMAVPVQASFTMSVLPSGSRGRGNSLIWLADSLARAASTLAGGALIAAAGYRLPYLLTAALYAAAALLFLRWFGRRQDEGRRTED